MKNYLPLVLLVLGACNAPSSQTPSSTNSTVAVQGVLEGTEASPTLDGKIVELSTTTVSQSIDQPDAIPSDLRPGVVIKGEAVVTDSKMTFKKAELLRETKGVIESIDTTNATITVLGTVVNISTATRLYEERVDDSKFSLTLADFVVGDFSRGQNLEETKKVGSDMLFS